MPQLNLGSSFNVKQLYLALWRWHFYAGLFVIPFLLMLTLSGFGMLIAKPVEAFFNPTFTMVDAGAKPLSAQALLSSVDARYPQFDVKLYIPSTVDTEAAKFVVVFGGGEGHGGHHKQSLMVYVNPYTGALLGAKDPADSFYALLETFHGSLFMGDIGDNLIEIASGLGVLMIISGLYLAWSKSDSPNKTSLFILKSRAGWRRLHRLIGFVIAIPLFLFLLSGLSWTNIWGGVLVQPWGSLPGTGFEVPKTEITHDAMNEHGAHKVPWALEQTPLPESKTAEQTLGLNSIVGIAKGKGLTHYRIHFPKSERGAWTISSTTIAGDITNPFAERTVHIDQSNGQILADLPFADYPLLGKAMAAFIPLHQGDLGWWNWGVNVFLLFLILTMTVSGLMMWLKRRPNNTRGLAAPNMPSSGNQAVLLLMFMLSLCFPLSALFIVSVTLFDVLVVSRLRRLTSRIP
jgi:uncharacterized iron-regulated membrane protein